MKESFGAANVNSTECDVGDGEGVPCTIIMQGGKEVARIFDDPESRTVVLGGGDWHTAEGVRIGTPAGDLIRLNGKPFKLWRFYWDFKAEVKSWEEGNLSKKWNDALAIRLSQHKGYSAEKGDPENQKLKKDLLDMEDPDALFSIENPSVQKLGLMVFEMVATLKK